MNTAPARRFAFLLSLSLGLGVAAVALLAVARAPIMPPMAAQGEGSPWTRAEDGLHGDNVLDLSFVGDANRNHRFFLMVSEGFGLFRSLSTLDSWRMVAPNPRRPDTTIVHSVAVARDDIDRLKVYVGLQATPLLAISEDGGATWSTEDGPLSLSRIDLLASTTGGRLWAAQRMSSDLWSSEDGGLTWQIDANPSGRRAELLDLFSSPDEARVWFVGAGRLYRSQDAPGSWQEMLGPSRAAPPTMTLEVRFAAAAPGGTLWAVGRRDGSWAAQRSHDAGATWQPAAWPAAAGGAPPTALGAGEVGFQQRAAWIGVEDGLAGGRVFETRDDGASWAELVQVPAAPRLVASDPDLYQVYVGTDGRGLFQVEQQVLHTGAVPVDTLAVVAPTFATQSRAYALAEVSPTRADLPGTPPAWRLILRSDDGGVSWSQRYVTTGLGTELFASPAFAADRRLYSGGHLSTDAGTSWQALGPRPGGGDPPYVVAVGPITNTRPALYGLRAPYTGPGSGSGGGLVFSGDGGQTWQPTDANVEGITAVAFSPTFADDATAFFVTDRGKFFRTVNALAFEEIGRLSLIAGQGSVPELLASPSFARDSTLVAVVDNRAAGQRTNVYLSNNGGRSWDLRSAGLAPRARPGSLILSPSFELDRLLFLGTARERADQAEAAIYASDSAGAEWFGELRLGPGAVRDFAWGGLASDGRVFAAAQRDGILWRDMDGSPIVPVLPTATASPTDAPPSATPTVTASPEVTARPSPTPTGQFELACVEAEADAHAQSSRPGLSTGLENELLVWSDDSETAIAYVRFVPPTLPAGSTVMSATVDLWLRAQQNQGAAPATELREVAEPWTESRLSWNSRPRMANALDSRTVDGASGWRSWSANGVIRDWYASASRNHGAAIVPANQPPDALRAKFSSRENPFDPAPRLCVRYVGPPPTAVPTGTPTTTPSVTPTASASPSASATPTPPTDEPPSPSPTTSPSPSPGTPATMTPEPSPSPVASGTATLSPTSAPMPGRIWLPFLVRGR